MNTPEWEALRAFRQQVYPLFGCGRDALFEALDAVLSAGLVCHLVVVVDGVPLVLPTGYGRIGDTFYLHGSSANRCLLAAAGQQVCVTVTLLDGLVCARAVFHNSMNYRSAVIFGEARLVTDAEEKVAEPVADEEDAEDDAPDDPFLEVEEEEEEEEDDVSNLIDGDIAPDEET